MGSCAKQVFSGITPAKFVCICQQITAKYGVTLSGDNGQETKSGFTIAWTFGRTTGEFDVQCLDSPIFISCGLINQAIHDLVDGC
jgi:hypothetical protein